MKRIGNVVRMALAIAAIVLLVLHLMGKGGESNQLLIIGLLCSSLSNLLQAWPRKKGGDKQDV